MRTTPVRVTAFVGGVILSAYMYLLVAVTTLGSSPLFVFEEGIVSVTGIPFGVVTAATGLLLLAVAAILRAPVGPGTLAVPLVFGLGVELMAPLVPSIGGTTPGGFVLRLAVLVIATHLMALGGALIVLAAFGAAAIDAVMLGLSSLLHRDTARVRMVMEVSLAASGAVVGGTAGLGTIVAGLTVGHSFRYWARLLGVAENTTPARAPCARSLHRNRPRTFSPSLSMHSMRPTSRKPAPVRDTAHNSRRIRTGTADPGSGAC